MITSVQSLVDTSGAGRLRRRQEFCNECLRRLCDPAGDEQPAQFGTADFLQTHEDGRKSFVVRFVEELARVGHEQDLFRVQTGDAWRAHPDTARAACAARRAPSTPRRNPCISCPPEPKKQSGSRLRGFRAATARFAARRLEWPWLAVPGMVGSSIARNFHNACARGVRLACAIRTTSYKFDEIVRI
jgi:hypothetical protein